MNLFLLFQYGLVGAFVVLLATFVLVMASESVEGYVSPLFGLDTKNATLQFLGIGMGGVLLALQALMAYKRAKALEDTANAQAEAAKAQAKAANAQADAAKAQADATKEQAKANQNTEQGQRQERLKNAIEHLGHPSDSVRLGGAYELFHLAADTKDLRQTVLDILCAHIRRTTGEAAYRKKHPSKPSEEIQSLLTLLFVQKHEVFKGCHINLQGSWLNGADLSGARLEKADLTKAYLQRADLGWALMTRAALVEARLQRAHLSGAQLQMAYLRKSHLQEAWLHEAHLQGALLDEAQFQGAFLDRANLRGALLHKAQFQGAILRDAQMQGSPLSLAQFQGADLTGAQLQATRLDDVRLQGVASQSEIFYSFEDRIKKRIGKGSTLSGTIFAGGLSQGDLDSLVKGLPHGAVKQFRERLEPHIDQPVSHELPEDSGAIIDPYTAEEAEQWIVEHNEAMSEVSEESDN